MTDFMTESAWADPVSAAPRDFWESTRPAPIQEHRASRPSLRAQRRPAAAIAADVHELLESMARKRVPRLDAVRGRLHAARAGFDLAAIEEALHRLHAATTVLDFLAGRSGGDAAAVFVRQGESFAGASAAAAERVAAFLQRHGTEGPVARLMWIDLVLESSSLHKRVRQGAHWLAEMDQDLVYRRKGPNTAVTLRAIDELSRRGQAMHERLQTVHRLCGHARRVHVLCEQQASERADLCATLQAQVQPANAALGEALQSLLHAATWRPLVATELLGAVEARHQLQVVLTQAGAQIVRLQAADAELASELACMEEKARRIG
jgi:hypothetical protein